MVLKLTFWKDETNLKMANLAAWIPSKGAALQIGPADIPEPGLGELVIEACLSTLRKS
jgi:hypothetical protein